MAAAATVLAWQDGLLAAAHGRARVVFTGRAGGVSRAPFDTLNLGRFTDDDQSDVSVNRERVAAEIGVQPEIELVEVDDAAAAAGLRFLGSPTVRVDGRDVEPGAEERRGAVLSCRVYRTERGVSGRPDEGWIRSALTGARE
jgi:hypothetical protein